MVKLPPIATHIATVRGRLKKSGHGSRRGGGLCGGTRASKMVHRIATGRYGHKIMRTVAVKLSLVNCRHALRHSACL